MTRWLMLVIAITLMAPVNSFAYTMIVEGDQGQPWAGGRSFEANAGSLTWSYIGPPPDEPSLSPTKQEASVTSRFMVVSDYGSPKHELTMDYYMEALYEGDVTLLYPESVADWYAGVRVGTSLGGNDVLFLETDDVSCRKWEMSTINLFTDTWYYVNVESWFEGGDIEGYMQTTAALLIGMSDYEKTPTPIPGAVWLLGSGLIGLVGLKNRRQSS